LEFWDFFKWKRWGKRSSKLILSFCLYVGRGLRWHSVCYKSEGRWFDSRWCHWNFSVT
jgi:uncharacterized membrane protein